MKTGKTLVDKGVQSYSGLLVPKWGLRERWQSTLYQEYSNRTWHNCFKLKENSFLLDSRKKFLMMRESAMVLTLVAQRSCECSIAAGVKARLDGLWAAWPRGRCPCPWQEFGTRWFVRFSPTKSILWFCNLCIFLGICINFTLHLLQ